MRRWCSVFLCLGISLFAVGCPKGNSDFSKGRKAETLQDYDAALEYYQKALKADPNNAAYKIRLNQARFEAGEMHISLGLKQRENGDLQAAAAQFQRAQIVDPSSAAAGQELKKTLDLIAQQTHANDGTPPPPHEEDLDGFAAGPPQLKPLSNVAITYKATGDAKTLFDTIGKLAGVTMIYDPDFPARRISVDLNNLTLEQALEVVCIESKAFWKPVTENIILIAPDQPQKRRDFEEESMKTYYLANTVTPLDLTEIVTGLRSLFEVKRVQQLNSLNAIVVRASPAVLTLVGKLIDDIDKARPEVVVQVEVLEARTDRLRNLGVSPGQSASIAINPNSTTTTGNSTTTNNTTFNTLRHLNSSDYEVTLPNFTANAVLTDTDTRIIQDPELRSVDGQEAKLKIGDRIPIATGSFQAGVGVGAVGAAGLVNPLVNTQFQYQDVGVNIDITPRVHPDHEISLKTKIEVSSVTGTSTIGGISQPIISQRVVEHEIRLKDGQASILGGLIQRTDTKTLNGWPGFSKIPILRYLFSSTNVDHQEDEVLIMLIPHIVRLPDWTPENLRAIYTGTEQQVEVRRVGDLRTPEKPAASGQVPVGAAPGTTAAAGTAPGAVAQPVPGGQLGFEPRSISLKVGEQRTIAVVVNNVDDLFSIPMLLQYNPAVLSVEDVQHAVGQGQHGGFLSGGTQEIAIVSNVNKEKGQAIISATRQPNTPGVSGSGTLLGIVVKAIAPGFSNISILQQNAKNSQQKPIPLVTTEATVQVQP